MSEVRPKRPEVIERMGQNPPHRADVAGLMSKVFALDRRIRYCAILDKTGIIIFGGMRPGRRSFEPEEEARKVDGQMAVIRGMTEGSVQYFGKTRFFIINREKLMLVAIPQGDGNTIEISTQPDFPLEGVKALIKTVRISYRRKESREAN
jgi:hypothetical protein